MREVNLHISRKSDTVALSVDNTTEANLRIDTHSGVGCLVNWRDGNVQILPSGSTLTHVYTTNFTGDVLVTPLGGYNDISRFQSTGSTAWNFDLGVFVPLTELTFFNLVNLPNTNIDGSLNSFTGANELTFFQLNNLPNATITGDLSAFSGMTGFDTFYIYNLPNATITGDLSAFSGSTGISRFWLYDLPNSTITGSSSDFASMTNLREFLISVSPNSTITMEYDDILNIWQNAVYVNHRYSGISASKATTDPFNFTESERNLLYFTGIGLSTQSMDNMIIALDSSLIAQTDPKIIYLSQNAPHSGSPAVMTALSNLATKNITVVL